MFVIRPRDSEHYTTVKEILKTPVTSTEPYIVYVLSCEHNKYYVGYTNDTTGTRFQKHYLKHKEGAKWTKLHRPVKPIATFYVNADTSEALAIEREVTLAVMKLYGVEHVRGGPWCIVEGYKPDAEFRKELETIDYFYFYTLSHTLKQRWKATDFKVCQVCLHVGHSTDDCCQMFDRDGDNIMKDTVH